MCQCLERLQEIQENSSDYRTWSHKVVSVEQMKEKASISAAPRQAGFVEGAAKEPESSNPLCDQVLIAAGANPMKTRSDQTAISGGDSLGLGSQIVLAQHSSEPPNLLAAQLRFQGGQLCFEVSRGFAFADDLFAISSEEVVDRFD